MPFPVMPVCSDVFSPIPGAYSPVAAVANRFLYRPPFKGTRSLRSLRRFEPSADGVVRVARLAPVITTVRYRTCTMGKVDRALGSQIDPFWRDVKKGVYLDRNRLGKRAG